MACQSRRIARDLNRELEQDSSQFSFFQAVRILGLTAPKRRGALPEKLRFRSVATLSFPASELHGYRPAREDAAQADSLDEMSVAFMGLVGPSAALPVHYTELVIERRLHNRDSTLHAFLDLFSHRATALFYMAWRKYRYWIAEEAGERDGFARNLLDLGGLGLQRLREQMQQDMALDEAVFIYYAGLLNQKPLSSQALVTLIEGFLGVKAQLEQFAGQWISLPETEQTRLGTQCCELGVSTFSGNRAWDRQTKLELRLGPLRRPTFDALQPDAPAATALRALLQFALGHTLACNVTLELDRRDVPPARLEADKPLRLGGNGWLGDPTEQQKRDPDEMRYALLH
ncbi:type VI secretion system protein ImpH [Formivibrio citricus]|uniref:Type VI secretion system protein ImpH n=1 Tax=Formivibrio citricus TaxID=83765 RepID=A0A1I4WSA0_9NEIS|nr:type VI secretion system baseplate subunit TssG [Formivibrio citricus]SFN16046.1 type VI secretion system protein ImpH [Formivibrio citricus]